MVDFSHVQLTDVNTSQLYNQIHVLWLLLFTYIILVSVSQICKVRHTVEILYSLCDLNSTLGLC
jgi:hypothetical protein